MKNIVYLDIETQLGKDDVGGWYPEKMKLGVAVTFDVENGFRTWFEKDATELIDEILQFKKVIGLIQG